MAREARQHAGQGRDLSDVVSVIASGMAIDGNMTCDGTVRIEGTVEGGIKASKSVVIGEGGSVTGDIETQDVVIAGRVKGTVTGESRVELQATCRIEGDIRSRRIKLDEGGQIDGRLHMAGRTASAASDAAARDVRNQLALKKQAAAPSR